MRRRSVRTAPALKSAVARRDRDNERRAMIGAVNKNGRLRHPEYRHDYNPDDEDNHQRDRAVARHRNASTWDTYCRGNRETGEFSGIVYGGGNRFMDSVSRLRDVFSEIGGTKRVLYFGDLDPQGLRIPRVASRLALRDDLPRIEPDLWSYSQFLSIGRQVPLGEANDASEADLEWIGKLGPDVRNVLNHGLRIAQESCTGIGCGCKSATPTGRAHWGQPLGQPSTYDIDCHD
jgi:hypothetical protein